MRGVEGEGYVHEITGHYMKEDPLRQDALTARGELEEMQEGREEEQQEEKCSRKRLAGGGCSVRGGRRRRQVSREDQQA